MDGADPDQPPFEPVSLTPEQKSKLQKLLADWNRIQGRLKRAEQISQLAVVPAINEIRYAGRMLVSALSALPEDIPNGIPTTAEALVSARQYLKNADHDISDALVYFFQGRVDEINRTFGAHAVIERYPAYADLLKYLERSRELVIASRANLVSRDKNYAEIADVIEKIIENYFILDKADVFMALEMKKHHARITRYRLTVVLVSAVAFAALGFQFIK